MPARPPHLHDSPIARRFAQVGIISLAALLTSGLGLLAYSPSDPPPEWLQFIALTAAAMTTISAAGWLIAGLAQFARARFSPR